MLYFIAVVLISTNIEFLITDSFRKQLMECFPQMKSNMTRTLAKALTRFLGHNASWTTYSTSKKAFAVGWPDSKRETKWKTILSIYEYSAKWLDFIMKQIFYTVLNRKLSRHNKKSFFSSDCIVSDFNIFGSEDRVNKTPCGSQSAL